MATKLKARFDVVSWDEHAYDVRKGAAKTTRAKVMTKFTGDVDGEARLEYLMAYSADGTAAFVGMQRIAGRVAGRTGTFVLQHVGRFEAGAAKAKLTVVPGSGTDELAGVTGTGDFLADPKGSIELSLTFKR